MAENTNDHEIDDILAASNVLFDQYEQTHDADYLNEAIYLAQNAIAIQSDHPSREDRLKYLRRMLEARIDNLGNSDDYQLAQNLSEEILNVSPRGGSLEKMVGEDLAHASQGINPGEFSSQGASQRNHGHSSSLGMHEHLFREGEELRKRYELWGNPIDLDSAISLCQQAYALTPYGDKYERSCKRHDLCEMLLSRFEKRGNPTDLDQAMVYVNRALSADRRHFRVHKLHCLSKALFFRFNVNGDMDDLQKGLKYGEEATKEMSPTDPGRKNILGNWSTAWMASFDRTRDVEQLKVGMILCEEALMIALNPPGYSFCSMLGNLGGMYWARFELKLDFHDLYKGKHALKAPPKHPHYADRLESLALAKQIHTNTGLLRVRSAQTIRETIHPTFDGTSGVTFSPGLLSKPPNIEEEIKLREERYKSMPAERVPLMQAYEARFEMGGDLDDLERAVALGEDKGRDGSKGTSSQSTALALILLTRFERSGDMDDLEKAIRLTQSALEKPYPSSHYVSMICNLSNMLARKFERTRNPEDMDFGLVLSCEALDLTSPSDPDYITLSNNHTGWLKQRFQQNGNLDDLHMAITLGEQILAATHPEDPVHAIRATNLAYSLFRRFRQTSERKDIDRAIKLYDKAVTSKPKTYPGRAQWLLDFMEILMVRWVYMTHSQISEQTTRTRLGRQIERKGAEGTQDDIRRAYYICLEIWENEAAPPGSRIIGARNAAAFLGSAGKPGEASDMYDKAIALMPKVSQRSLKRNDQQYLLAKGGLSTLGVDAAAMAINAGKGALHALQLLELGRGVIMGFAIDCRSDLSNLMATHPEIARKFGDLRAEIDSPLSNSLPDDRSRKQAISDFEDTLAYIRQIPGHEGFLLPPNPKELMMMATEGPIVIVNTTFCHSDAIIVTSSEIKLLELPLLEVEEAEVWMERMTKECVTGSLRTYGKRNKLMSDLLMWLWNVIVEPVLGELRLDRSSDTNQTHIWWIGVGKLGMAPFHAAGDHSPGSTCNTMSRAISSYIPTIRALSHARQKDLRLFSGLNNQTSSTQTTTNGSNTHVLLVAMPTTAGHAALLNVSKEVADIVDILPPKSTSATILESPSAEQVLDKLRSSQVIHFACHGVSDAIDPSNSRLLLKNHANLDDTRPDTFIENTGVSTFLFTNIVLS